MSAGTDREVGRRLRRRCLAVLVALLAALTLPVGPASASDGEDAIVGYRMTIDLDDAGVAHVGLDLDVDFGQEPNHGPYLTYLVKQRFDDTQDRVYRFTDVRVGSSTGASPQTEVEVEGSTLALRIGDPDRGDLVGVHSYRIEYRVEGWVNSASWFGPTTGLADDELYLNVLSDWAIPVRDIVVQVSAPDEVLAADCFAGRSSQAPCTSLQAVQDAPESVVFTQDGLPAGAQLTVVARYPAGTFGDAPPILQDRWAFDRAFALTPATGAVTLVVAVLLIGAVVHAARRRGRDEQYLGLTPGLVPVQGQDAPVGARRRAPVAVRFTPPEGFRSGQLGTLIDERADTHDVTATLIGLAVRGFLRIEQVTDGSATRWRSDDDWRLVRLRKPPHDPLLPYEAKLLKLLFDGERSVLLSDLRTTFASSMARIQDLLYEDVTERGWFRGNPKKVRAAWAGRGVLLVLAGVVATTLLAIWTSWALVGVPVVVAGIVMLATVRTAPARTAAGTAVLVQAQGFRHYLATAEADQIRFEEGEDLFSRYLPYAVAFGLTERWAKVFADLAAQGRAAPEPTWYVGSAGHTAFWLAGSSFAHDLTSFTHSAGTALAAPTPGSSGSSGGGGFSGGGVSGGGGGTW